MSAIGYIVFIVVVAGVNYFVGYSLGKQYVWRMMDDDLRAVREMQAENLRLIEALKKAIKQSKGGE